jgi:hypothetical protein
MKTLLKFALIFGAFSGSVANATVGKDLFSGAEVSFPDPAKKATVLVFLSAVCPCSESHEKGLKGLAEVYSKKGYQFVAVHSNQDEPIDQAKSHFKKTALPFSVLNDVDAKIANEFKALKTPHAFILKGKEIVYQGGVDDSSDAEKAKIKYLEVALAEFDSGKSVTLSKTRTLGCVIKR